MKTRESWRSRLGFVLAASGSAVGLVNIWRFPYVVGENGGGAFILLYLLFLGLIGYPVLVSEVTLGRASGMAPAGALRKLSGRAPRFWAGTGIGIILTGFIVSSFYSVVAGWVVGYLVDAATGALSDLRTLSSASEAFARNTGSATWCVGYHFLFMALSAFVLSGGIRRGIERVNKILMPTLVILLLVVMVRGLTLPGGYRGVAFLLRPDWRAITAMSVLTALGHAFFTLSLGQGTMITYGSYLDRKASIPEISAPIVIFDTVVSLLAGIAVLSVVFGAGATSAEGVGLLFSTLPTVFASIPLGGAMAFLFFLLVLMAAVTSQTSAMQPAISYLVDEKGWKRGWAVTLVAAAAFAVGVPSALAFNVWRGATLWDLNIFEIISSLTMDFLIPLGGLVAVLYVGWFWGWERAFPKLHGDHIPTHFKARVLHGYLGLCIRYLAPLLIILIIAYQL